jgi:hypothetical protein
MVDALLWRRFWRAFLHEFACNLHDHYINFLRLMMVLS